MTIPTELVITFLGACLGLLAYILKKAIAGELTDPSKVVPREMYDKQVAINEADTDAILQVATNVKKLAIGLKQVVENGNGEKRQ